MLYLAIGNLHAYTFNMRLHVLEVVVSEGHRILRFSDLKALGVPWCRVHIDRLERAGKFPKRVHLGPGTVGWVEAEVTALISDAMSARQTDAYDTKQAA